MALRLLPAPAAVLLPSPPPKLPPPGLQAQLAAAQQVRSRSGEFAALLSKGPSAAQELQGRVLELEATRQLLQQNNVKPLLGQVAQHNDCHIVVVSES